MSELHVFFFPFMAHGHMIPILDIAKLFSSHNVKSTIITTPLNAPFFTKAIRKLEKQLPESEKIIEIQIIKFPTTEFGLPETCEIIDRILPSDLLPKFFKATTMLKDQVEQLVQEHQPSCLVADMFFPWANDIADKFKIPTLLFHGTSFFSMCASQSLMVYKPQRGVSSDDEPFILPNLPHKIKLTKTQIPLNQRGEVEEEETDFSKLLKQVVESDRTCFGVIFNSFYELEPDYADYYRNVLGRREWHIGPVSLCNRGIEDKAQRGKEADVDEHECLKWLDSKKPHSVIYICFGSMARFSDSQLYEIAMGLLDSEQDFIWVVKKKENDELEESEKWLSEGFEEKIREKGLIIRGWAPQVLILDHEAVGGFVTHCGWNSALESISAGVPMVTWPLFAEQFYNEKLLTQVLKIGVGVGALEYSMGANSDGPGGRLIQHEEITKAVKRVMVGEESAELRIRARGIKEMATKAVEEGGSSYSDLCTLLQEISAYHA